MRTLDIIASVLLIVGGLNWLLVGAFQFDLVAAVFDGQSSTLSRIVYILVGLSAIWLAVRLPSLFDTAARIAPTVRRTDSSL